MKTILGIAAATLVLVCAGMVCAGMARAADPSEDYSRYSVSDGALRLDDAPVNNAAPDDPDVPDPTPHKVGDRHLTPEALSAGVPQYWSLIPRESNAATALFFSGDGKFMFAVPLEHWSECHDAIPSPGGQKIILVGGAPWRPFRVNVLYDYSDRENPSKLAEFDTVIGDPIQWLDPGRFVFTLMGSADNRLDVASDVLLSGAFYVSLYDTTISERVDLKEPTDTQNFMLKGVADDKKTVEIIEHSVKDPADWKKEDTELRKQTLTVPIPSAG
ncbi:MAG: hypothetical protein LBS53_05190 [Synergistaceae bacterium]|jgi:hypothetical protein|nr:hypothetical protein [Synergistaceae bacterium]